MPRNQDENTSAIDLLDATELARRLRISPWKVQEMRRRGELPKPVKLGSLTRWKVSDIARMLDRMQRQSQQPRDMRGAVRKRFEEQYRRRTGNAFRVRLRD